MKSKKASFEEATTVKRYILHKIFLKKKIKIIIGFNKLIPAFNFSEISEFIKDVKNTKKLQPELTYAYLLNKYSPDYILSHLKNQTTISSNSLKSLLEHEQLQNLFKRLFLGKFLIIGVMRLVANLLLFTGPIFQDLLTDNLKDYQDNHDHNQEDLDRRFINLFYSITLFFGFLLNSKFYLTIFFLFINFKSIYEYF